MASVTRSRRVEALPPPVAHRHHGPHPHPGGAIATHTRAAGHNILQQANSPRPKRPFDPSGRDFEVISRKKTRLTVEIVSKPPGLTPKRASAAVRSPPSPPQPAAARPNRIAAAAVVRRSPSPLLSPALTKHREKVINGIRHELDRLQPSSADTRAQGRKLRSQEASRFKSELSAYFPDYDEIIGNDPKEQREENPLPPPLQPLCHRCSPHPFPQTS